jgi:tRNA pseudouridine55 synthase
VAVEMPTRRTTVYELELEEYEEPMAQLSMRLSSGGYVRAVAEALGGHCVSLRRTHVGPFDVAEADAARIIPPEEAVAALSQGQSQ